MIDKYRLIKEDKLIILLESYIRLRALESGGVDNWEWYGESIGDFIQRYIEENNIIFEDEDDKYDFTIEDIAKIDIDNYQIIEI